MQRLIDIDVVCKSSAAAAAPGLAVAVKSLLVDLDRPLEAGERIEVPPSHAAARHVRYLRVCDLLSDDDLRLTSLDAVRLHAHALHEDELEEAELEPQLTGDAQLPAFHLLAMPNRSTDGAWESLIFDSDVKRQLMRYATAALALSRRPIDANLVSWNRLVLFHGPPGTGKTSLCKALAHKLAVRMRGAFRTSELVEVNAHSLFSRWFSESGKQVMTLFERIREMADDTSCLVCVLVDEVESLASARRAALNGSEPSDSMRVVNALLTQLDSLRKRPNVLVMATSNITESIDVAFIDRADLKIQLPPPSLRARIRVLADAVAELVRHGAVAPPPGAAESLVLSPNEQNASPVSTSEATSTTRDEDDDAQAHDAVHVPSFTAAIRCVESALGPLLEQAEASGLHDSLSGRTLRKLPVLAFVHSDINIDPSASTPVPWDHYVQALGAALLADAESRDKISSA